MGPCLDESTLAALMDWRLSTPEQARVDAHLDACASCRQLAAEVARAVAATTGHPRAGDLGPEPPAAGLATGAKVGRYTVQRRLGSGAMGTVYAAYDPELEREVALKLVPFGADAASKSRVLREAKAIARLAHPNVVSVYDTGAHEGFVFIAMELIGGGTLREWLAEARREPPAILAMFAQAGRGLAAAHAAGLVHRDFKPDNVLLGTDGRARVGDFGLARAERSDPGDSPQAAAMQLSMTVTQPGALLGTPLYMAPEQLRGERADQRADIFAFSVALYQALYAVHPFAGVNVAELRVQIERGRVRAAPPGTRVPDRLRDVVLRGLRAAPQERYDSMTELLEDLERGARGGRLRPSLRWAALGALLVAGAAAILSTRGETAKPSPDPAVLAAPSGGGAPSADDSEEQGTVYRVPLEDSPRRGGREPLVTIVEFGDFECPYTGGFEERMKRILERYGDDVALVWKSLDPDYLPLGQRAARVAMLAREELGDPGFWRAHDRLFAACTEGNLEDLERAAGDLGLPREKVRSAIEGPATAALDRDFDLAFDLGVGSVPTTFFNGRRVSGAQPLERLKPLIEQELARARSLVASGVPRARIYEALQASATTPGTPRVRLELPDDDVVLAGSHAVLDVHQLASETSVFTGLLQPSVDWVLEEYGDRIRFHWHWVPDASDAMSMHVASVSSRVRAQASGSDVFWRFHRLVIDNVPWPFRNELHDRARGLGDASLMDYARSAGLSPLYLQSLVSMRDDPERWKPVQRLVEAHDIPLPILYADGYLFGSYRRGTRRVLDALLAGKGR